MDIELHRADDRGLTETDWLQSRHSFSFGEFYDPRRTSFGALRVLNEDIVAPGEGFRMHNHADMEIVTILLDGALAHKDSEGNDGLLEPWDVQRMSAGTGIAHSEFNNSDTEPVHLLQLWLEPKKVGLNPSYSQMTVSPTATSNLLLPIVAAEGKGVLRIHQDATLLLGTLDKGTQVSHATALARGTYVFIIDGTVDIEGVTLNRSDAAAITGATLFHIKAASKARALVIDVPMQVKQ